MQTSYRSFRCDKKRASEATSERKWDERKTEITNSQQKQRRGRKKRSRAFSIDVKNTILLSTYRFICVLLYFYLSLNLNFSFRNSSRLSSLILQIKLNYFQIGFRD